MGRPLVFLFLILSF